MTWLMARLTEASTWAGIAAMGAGFDLAAKAGAAGDYVAAGTAVIGGIVAFVKAEKGAV